MILTKEEFVGYIDFIREQNQKQDRFIDAPEDMLVELIRKILKDKDDDIGYLLYDMDYAGKGWKDISRLPRDDNGNVLYNSPETLYDYLVSNMKKGEELAKEEK